MAEDLANYYTEVGVRCRYMHSEIETLERIKLLREDLDLPEVSLVAILDAHKEGFLGSRAASFRPSAAPPATSNDGPRDF